MIWTPRYLKSKSGTVRGGDETFFESYNLAKGTWITSWSTSPFNPQAFHRDTQKVLHLHLTSMYLVILRSSAVPFLRDSKTFSAGRRATLIWSCRDEMYSYSSVSWLLWRIKQFCSFFIIAGATHTHTFIKHRMFSMLVFWKQLITFWECWVSVQQVRIIPRTLQHNGPLQYVTSSTQMKFQPNSGTRMDFALTLDDLENIP